eukprot:sb/3472994/
MATVAQGRKVVLINPSSNAGMDASAAIDGDVTTEYHSSETLPEAWIQFHLQDASIISTVTMVGRTNYGTFGYRIQGTQVRIYSEQQSNWTTCGTVDELHLSDPEYTINCPDDIIATKLWLYDNTVATNGIRTESGVIMTIKEVTVYGHGPSIGKLRVI